jgi:hypothetical protein
MRIHADPDPKHCLHESWFKALIIILFSENLNMTEYSRLPAHTVPVHYDLHLDPCLTTCTFRGHVAIHIETRQPLSQLVLNANSFQSVNLTALRRVRQFPSIKAGTTADKKLGSVSRRLASAKADDSSSVAADTGVSDVDSEPPKETEDVGSSAEGSGVAKRGGEVELKVPVASPPTKKARPCPARKELIFSCLVQCCGSETIFSGFGSHFRPSFGFGSGSSLTSEKLRIQFRIRP